MFLMNAQLSPGNMGRAWEGFEGCLSGHSLSLGATAWELGGEWGVWSVLSGPTDGGCVLGPGVWVQHHEHLMGTRHTL